MGCQLGKLRNKLNALHLENSWPLKACKDNVNIANKKSYLSNRIGRKGFKKSDAPGFCI